MPVVKRYPNRKLYDTAARRYVTLLGIARLVRAGEPVQVLDSASGEDLTGLVLSQVITELERGRGGFLPHAVLSGLIQAGGETLARLASPPEPDRRGAGDEAIERALARHGVPTRADLERLDEQVEALARGLAALEGRLLAG